MNRRVDDKNLLNDFCTRFCRIIGRHAKYIVVSGFVAIASGRMRGTEDIDIIIERLGEKGFRSLHSDIRKAGFVATQSDDAKELYSYLADNLSIRYTSRDAPVPEMEMKFSKDALDTEQLKHRAKLPLTGLDIWFGSINMNIAFKEELLKSPKDMEDARHLRIVYSDVVDEEEIAKFKRMIKRYRL